MYMERMHERKEIEKGEERAYPRAIKVAAQRAPAESSYCRGA